MGRIFQNSGGTMTEMFRRDEHGQIVTVMPEFSEYQTPPRGTRARMTLSGISDEFEMDSQYSDTPVKRVRVEFTLDKVSGNAKMLEGKRFTDIYPAYATPNSKLGKLFARLRDKPLGKTELSDIDAYIGTSFVGVTDVNGTGEYAKLPENTIEAGSIKLPPGFWEAQERANNGGGSAMNDAPIPEALQPVGAATGEGDPFGLDDL